MFIQNEFMLETSLQVSEVLQQSMAWLCAWWWECEVSLFLGGWNHAAVPRWVIEASDFLICRQEDSDENLLN